MMRIKKNDANALMPAIESVEKKNLEPKEVTADSIYGSDENCERAKQQGVELIAPAMGSVDKDKLILLCHILLYRVYCPPKGAVVMVRSFLSFFVVSVGCWNSYQRPIDCAFS